MATKPVINQLRAGYSLRELNAVLGAIRGRLEAVEAALELTSTTTVQAALAGLLAQADGLVGKVAGELVIVKPATGLSLTKKASTLAGYQLSLAFDDATDGLVVRTGDTLTTRTLTAASGYAGSIVNPDGVAGDPTFHS